MTIDTHCYAKFCNYLDITKALKLTYQKNGSITIFYIMYFFVLFVSHLVAFMKIGDKLRCDSSRWMKKGQLESIGECAQSCHGVSSVFIYGTTEWGLSKFCRGTPPKCACYCETSADNEGKCSLRSNRNYNLYKYT